VTTPCTDDLGNPCTGGGGQIGLLAFDEYVKPNSSDLIDQFNTFSVLASIEDLFGLSKLGYSASATPFGDTFFYTCWASQTPCTS